MLFHCHFPRGSITQFQLAGAVRVLISNRQKRHEASAARPDRAAAVGRVSEREPWAMAEIINLREARKRKNRADKEARAAQKRAQHGRTGAETKRTAKERERSKKLLDGNKLDPDAG